MATGNMHSYVAGNFCLMLGKDNCGFLQQVKGGGISADVIPEKIGPGGITRKHLGSVKYEDFTVDAGVGMAAPFWDWIKDAWAMRHVRHDGSIIACNYNFEAQTEREFFKALITEVTFPPTVAGGKDAGLVTVKFSPELTRTKKASGKVAYEAKKVAQKVWLPHNFKLEIPGLDCTHVTKIDQFTVKQTVSEHAVGEMRDYEQEPASLEFPNLKITLTASTAESWQTWFKQFVIEGNNDEGSEKTGVLHYLTPNLKEDLFSIQLHNLGIFRLADEPVTAHTDQVHRVTAELYCERMELIPPKS